MGILNNMAEVKLVISNPKTGKSVQKALKDDSANSLSGFKIGDNVEGDTISLKGYNFLITGGSDDAGFPMRKDVTGTGKRKILAIKGVGLKKKAKGIRQRKTVAGNTIHDGTAQINLKILKEGSENLFAEAKEASAENKEEAGKETKPNENATKESAPTKDTAPAKNDAPAKEEAVKKEEKQEEKTEPKQEKEGEKEEEKKE